MTWHPSHDGLVPVIENPLFPGFVTSFETHDSVPFVLPYREVDGLIVDEAYR